MEVRTGVSGGRAGPRPHFGRRTLCPECAARHRASNRVLNYLFLVVIVAGAIVGAVMYVHANGWPF
jgi:hypothetical protein